MSDCDAGDSAPSAHVSSALDTSTHCSSSVEPPPDYATCVSHPETGSSNRHSGTTDTTHHSHSWHPIAKDGASEPLVSGPILHGVASSAPFLDTTPSSENRNDGCVPGYSPYNPQPSYNPSYLANRPITPRPNVYGKKTIVLTRTDAQNSARKKKMCIGLCVGLIIGAIIPIATLIIVLGGHSRHSSRKHYGHEPKKDLQYDGLIFDTPRHTTVSPYLTDAYKHKYDDTYGQKENSDTPSVPFPDDKYKGTVYEKPWEPKTDDDIMRELGIDVDGISKTYEDAMNAVRGIEKGRDRYDDFREPVIPPLNISDSMKDLLGIPRDENTKEKKWPKWK